MRPIIFVFLLGQAFGASLAAQNCLQYATLMQNARNYWSSGEFDKALKQLTAAREHCPDKSKEIDEQFIAFTREISDKYKEATRQTKRANHTRQKKHVITNHSIFTSNGRRHVPLIVIIIINDDGQLPLGLFFYRSRAGASSPPVDGRETTVRNM